MLILPQVIRVSNFYPERVLKQFHSRLLCSELVREIKRGFKKTQGN